MQTKSCQLKSAFASHFLIGAAINDDQAAGRAPDAAALARKHFNTVTPENVMKWALIHPEPGRYDFEAAERFVAFGEESDMFVVGHTLVWHNQTPSWIFEDAPGKPVSPESLLETMRDHIHTVVGRYKGRVHAWDVVNEALNEDGSLRDSPWLRILGEDYLVNAFRFAHEADPDAKLYYNDYNIENPAKRDGAVRLVRRLQQQGVPVHGVGIQNHVRLDWPTQADLRASIEAFAALGVAVMITELEVDPLPPAFEHAGAEVTLSRELTQELNPYANGLPKEVQEALAQRYAELFRLYLEYSSEISRVTFWGVHDGVSWLNDWPVRGRTSYPLLFDRELSPKPAFDAVVGVVDGGEPR